MHPNRVEAVHDHATWTWSVHPEYAEDGHLHRHRLLDGGPAPHYTTWEHNGHAHAHRLPDGAWSGQRRDQTPAHLVKARA